MSVSATLTTWADVEDLADGHLSTELREALAPLAKQQVVHLQLPYGEKIISGGKFRWELLGDQADWSEAYGTTVPVTLVASKTVELYDVIKHWGPGEDGRPVELQRSVPLFMTIAGEFFGLFENFAGYSTSTSMRGTVGGTTLVALPAIGNFRDVKNFLDALGMGLNDKAIHKLTNQLKTENSSKMKVGPFLRDVLAHEQCDWRCHLIILSPCFVQQIQKSTRAALAIKTMTLSQLAVSHRRVDRTLGVFETVKSRSGPTTAEVQALHLIADGSRPGFVPVIGSPTDEEVLPAAAIHRIVYGQRREGDQRALVPLDPEEHFPLLFRPSLPKEACFYLLGRPFLQGPNTRKASAETRVEGLLDQLSTSQRGHFWHADPKAFAAWLIDFARDSEHEVSLPRAKSHFLRLGIIGFTPDHGEIKGEIDR